MMHAHYINPLIQFGYIAFDLCFVSVRLFGSVR